MKYAVVVLICCLVFRTSGQDYSDNEVERECAENCPKQDRTDKGQYGYACDHKCTIEQCINGCQLWRQALTMTCREACETSINGTVIRLTPESLSCVLGCNDALARYSTRLRARLGTPPAPALLADSLRPDALKLEWRPPSEAERAGLTCRVQWRYEEHGMTATSWQYCENATWNAESGAFDVEDLQPYTKYRFRIVLTSSSLQQSGAFESIVSAESVVISTTASGAPGSPPQNVRATPVDATSVTINWEPGPFPHGPLLSYVLNISDHDARTYEVKDISPDNRFIIVNDVRPSTNYTVELSMRNAKGSGPPASVSVYTPDEQKTYNFDQPPLILGTNNGILERRKVLDALRTIYRSKNELKGLGFHYRKQLLFTIESDGVVSRISLQNSSTEIIDRLETKKLDFIPLDLTVDWLNDHLYILGEVKFQISKYIIKRCNLDGSGLIVAFTGLIKKPSCMQIDPLNGYLFWTVQDAKFGGLFRLDIDDISNGIQKKTTILNETDLGAFTFEYHKFNIMVSYQSRNTIQSVSLDGKEVVDIRNSVTTPKLNKVKSIAMMNRKFYWTDGTDVFYEEYYEETGNFFHNTIPQLTNGNYKTVFINLQSFQPWPTPINPPTNVEAIFGRDIAKTRWNPPQLVGLQGKGAWKKWSYQISIKDVNTGKTTIHANITNTFFTITDLKENTEYILKVAAYTNSGVGPWSVDFQGTTLNSSKSPILLWSGVEGLLRSNAAGENVETIIDKNDMEGYNFVDIAAYKDNIFLVTNTSQVYSYNSTSKLQKPLEGLDSVGSIAVDWIGMKLYWTNSKLQSIFRGNLDGTEEEPLISEIAKELNIDSMQAYIYWSTGNKVESARLNGSERYKYQDVLFFSGKEVMGLTLDLEQKYIYWIVRGFKEGSILYRARMQGYWKNESPKVEEVSSLQKSDIQGPLCYFHKRLLWLQDDKHAAISDLSGKNIATISGNRIRGLNTVYVVDNSLYTLSDDANPWVQLNVRPEAVVKDSINVVGSSDAFNITWMAVDNVNHGEVFYEVKIDDPSNWNDPPKITITNSLEYWREISPFTPLNITVKAFTYWASSFRVETRVFSPSSTPSAPVNLRAFVDYKPFSSQDNYIATIIVRWGPPSHPNGVIQGFKVRCWCKDNEIERDMCDHVTVPGNETEYRKEVIESTSTDYYFELQAFTKVGLGLSSNRINVSIAMEKPIPTLLLANQNSIYLQDIDINATTSLIDSVVEPKEVTYLFSEKNLFWFDRKGELFKSDIQEMTTSKFYEVQTGAKGMTIDWIERSLYYSRNFGGNKSSIYKINLNLEPLNSRKVLERKSRIVDVGMSPFTRSLYWIETTDNETEFKMMKSDCDGMNIEPFFPERNSSSCSCPLLPDVGPLFTIDHSDVNIRPKLIFINTNTKSITWADQNGCECGVVGSESKVEKSVEVEHLEVDSDTIYWADKNGLHTTRKQDGEYVSVNLTTQNRISDMIIYGQHMQPYPPEKCLSIKSHNYSITLTSQLSTSLIFEMPQPLIDPECMNISMATTKYTIFYTNYTAAFERCDESNFEALVTSGTVQEINGLKPYTKYLVCVSVRNRFSKEDIIGPPNIFQTAPGVPSKPRNISAKVLSPNLAVVTWQPPEELNGDTVSYEIHWQNGAPSGIRQKGELSINDSNVLSTFLNQLSPNETYTIWVRVYGKKKNETSNDSDRIHITTYPKPTALVLANRTAYKLEVSWEPTSHIDKYDIEYAMIATNEWINIQNVQLKNRTAIIEVDNLKPKTQYKFRLKLWYDGNKEVNVWPMDSNFIFETLGDRPSPPGIPIIEYVKPNIYKVIWEHSKNNGAPIEMYKLEGKILRYYRNKRSTNRTVPFFNTAPSIELEDPDKWEIFYNGTNNSWIMNGLDEKQKYAFRVSALNSYGWSNTSEESNEFDPMAAKMAEKQNPMKLILIATLVPISICAIFVLIFVYLICSGKRSKQKKLQQLALSVPRAPDVELATLRELPRRGVHNTNLLYVSTQPSPDELTFLPQIKREQITLTKFLGSGAFGEVFEGKAKGISSTDKDTKVAVKTLKKGASDQEKSEFLQEAQLMSHFKHEHILQLLGVCLDNDPHFIIMELMEGGDLLTYLRDSRSVSTNTPPLTLIELLKMCVDVSKGCRYLEEMHFVHRDLACRNCLVSSFETESRIVKIGDFGLARDIYKNDYYRKEGEGLLPVRWMAPESLVDGVFTSQSDVWAFGVLLWEIMTLGQQPYPARANLEVLHYVRRGGRLGKPIDCPEELHSLMLKCWSFDPEERPTFKYCFQELETVHRKTLRNPTTAAHEGQYISTVPEMIAVSNEAYFRDENHNSSGNSWKSDNEDEAIKEKTPFLDKQGNQVEKEIPKYLELIYEPRPVLENDGYEVPNQMIEKLEEIKTCGIPNRNILADIK